MAAYLLRRILLVVPTLLGIMVLNFIIVQFAPGGPIEQIAAEMMGATASTTDTISGGGDDGMAANASDPAASGAFSGAAGLDPALVAELEAQYGFDKPFAERFVLMIWQYVQLDFGMSYYQDRPVVVLVAERLPVSISLGLWSLLLIYLISIPLGVRKAVMNGTPFDVWTSAIIFTAYAIPGFLFAIMLVVLFAGGYYWDLFPLRGLVSADFDELPTLQKIGDYFWHLALPILSLTVGGFATLTMLTKNSFLEEINKQFVLTARAKGISELRVLYGHVFRNAMLIVIASFPSAFIGILFTGSLLIEVIFSLDGIGLLGYEAILKRDYPIIFGTLFVFTLLGLVMNIVGDLVYTLIDPRIDFESRDS